MFTDKCVRLATRPDGPKPWQVASAQTVHMAGIAIRPTTSGRDPYGLQFRDAPGVLQGFDGVFGRESAHNLCQVTVGGHVDWCRINSLHVLGGSRASSAYFHNKFDNFHVCLLSGKLPRESCAAIYFHNHIHRFETLATPHSRQRGLRRDVINPQDGHILCDRNPMACGFSLRIQCSSRNVKNTISRPKEILVAFIKAPFLASSASTQPVAQTAF